MDRIAELLVEKRALFVSRLPRKFPALRDQRPDADPTRRVDKQVQAANVVEHALARWRSRP